MTISLYYIEGISEIDTPYFDTLNEQELYFADKLFKEIDNTFYPPYFTNLIKFSSDDLTINDKVNYISFVYEDKTYYYFVKSISYVSESIIELSCKLDSIQTFMFNINVSSGIIERMFINRWNGDAINRNYMRENVSDGLFKLSKYYEYSNKGVIILKSSSNLLPDATNTQVQGLIIDTNKISNLQYYILPAYFSLYFNPEHHDYIAYSGYELATNNSYTYYSTSVDRVLQYESEATSIYDIYYLPFIPIDNVSYSTHKFDSSVSHLDTSVPVLSISSDNACVVEDNKPAVINLAHLTKVSTKYNSNLYNLSVNNNNFLKNSSINILFNSKYCPCLIDENYMQLKFGERGVNTTYPLSRLNTSSIYLKYWGDIASGCRYYSMSDVYSTDDEYLTTCVATTAISFDLRTDYYKDYISRNKFTLLTSAVSDASKLIGTVAGVSMSTKYGINKIMSSSNSYDKRYNNPTLKTKYQGKLNDINESAKENYITAGLGFNSSTINELTNRANLMYTPDTVKSVGSSITDMLSKSCTMFNSLSYVEDIEQVAQYYHRNGYLVNKYVSEIGNTLFSYVNTRYYFNVLKFVNSDIHLNILESDDIIDDISDRLSQSIRLWNVVDSYTSNSITLRNYEIGNFSYDNVEKDYIS